MSESDTAFGPFVLNRRRGTLLRDGRPISLGPRAIALLDALTAGDGAPVTKRVLLTAGWEGAVVEESNLTVQIAALRHALGKRRDGQEWIVTVPRVGYRLTRDGAADDSEPPLPTVAILPFQNLAGDLQQEYFADGMVDDLIAALSRFKSFAVIGREPSFGRKGLGGDAEEVAAELGVGYLLEGSVRRSGSRLRLVAQLMRGVDGATLWAETFEGPIEDVFDFQDKITRAVAAAIEPQVQHAELERAQRERPTSIAGYDLYLRALAQMYVHTQEANAEAFSLLQQALVIEPENAVFLAIASWAMEYRITVGWPPITSNDQAVGLELAHRGLRVAGDNARVLGNCGLAIQSMGGEFDLGQLIVDRAVRLNPNDLAVLHIGGVSHMVGGDLEEGLSLLHKAIEIQPDHAYEAMGIGAFIYVILGRYAEAAHWAARAIAINNKYLPAQTAATAANAHLGRIAAARAALASTHQLVPGETIESIRQEGFRDRARLVNVLEGLRLAGMPER